MLRLLLLRFLESFFRYRWPSLAPIALMAGAAGVWIALTTPIYVSAGTIYTQKQSLLATLVPSADAGVLWVTPAQAAVNEFNELLQTNAFVHTLVEKTDLKQELTDDLAQQEELFAAARQAIWVATMGDNLLSVGARHDTPQLAQQLASATIEAYLQWKINSELEESDAAQAFFSALIQKYQSDVDTARKALQDYLTQHPEPLRGDRPATEQLEVSVLKAAVEQADTRLRGALDKEENARLNQAKAEGDVRQKYLVVDAPGLPEKPINSRKSQIVSGLIFVVVGVILSLVGIAGAALIDRSFRFALDVRNRLDLPVLASVPIMAKAGKGKASPKQTGSGQPARANPKAAT